jgi:hypothetical protein
MPPIALAEWRSDDAGHSKAPRKPKRSPYGTWRLILFGRGQTDPDAARDLDVDGIEGWTIWRLAAELEEALDIPLDVIPLDSPTPFTRRVEERGEVLLDE